MKWQYILLSAVIGLILGIIKVYIDNKKHKEYLANMEKINKALAKLSAKDAQKLAEVLLKKK